jgi:hypothetical protein
VIAKRSGVPLVVVDDQLGFVHAVGGRRGTTSSREG